MAFFGFLGVVFSYFFGFLLYCLKFIFYLFLLLLFALWKHQGAILYQRHAPSRKRQIAYNPNSRLRNPEVYKFDFDDFFVVTKDKVNIHCWLLRQLNSNECSTIVCFHGNAGNIGYRLPNANQMFRELQSNILMVDYRGYGNSEGVPSELGIIYDAEAVIIHLLKRNDIDRNKIFIFGRSLGGAVAIDLVWRCCTNRLLTIPKNCIEINTEKPNNFDTNLPNIKEEENDENDENDTLIVNNKKIDLMNNNNNNNNNKNKNKNKNKKKNNKKDNINNNNDNNNDNNSESIKIAGLIIENTFTSILDMVLIIIRDTYNSLMKIGSNNNNNEEDNDLLSESSDILPINSYTKYLILFLKYFITNRWDSLSKMKDITLPILFLSGLSDELIPPRQMQQLYKETKKSALSVMQTYPNGDHNQTWQKGGQPYWDDFFAFLTSTSFMSTNNDNDNDNNNNNNNIATAPHP